MSALTPAGDLGAELDLDAARAARAEKNTNPALTLAGRRVEIPAELPLDVLEPLTGVDIDISLLVRMALDARRNAEEQGEQVVLAIIDAVVDIFAANPKLPLELIDAVKEMARRLFGEQGYAHLVASRLALPEAVLVGRWAARQYGVGLGESSESSDSSEGTGTTSKPTSSGRTRSTSAASGRRPARRAS